MSAVETATAAGALAPPSRLPLKAAVKLGLMFGAVAVYITVVGILPMFDQRWIVVGVVSLGHAALIAIALGAGAATVLRSRPLKPLPAASSAAASLPRSRPSSPFFSFRSRSCFSISVALAQKIAGRARNNPPVTGPHI